MNQFPWREGPDDDLPFDNEVYEEALSQNLRAFLMWLCSYGKTTWKLETLLHSVNFRFFLSAPYPVWTYNPANLITANMYLVVYDVVVSGTAYAVKPSAGQVNSLMSALRDICFNPFVPIEYILALSGETSEPKTKVMWEYGLYLNEALEALVEISKSCRCSQPKRIFQFMNDIKWRVEHFNMTLSSAYPPDISMIIRMIGECEGISKGLASIAGSLDMEILMLPQLPSLPSGVDIESLNYSDMGEYIPIRFQRFVEDWNSDAEN